MLRWLNEQKWAQPDDIDAIQEMVGCDETGKSWEVGRGMRAASRDGAEQHREDEARWC